MYAARAAAQLGDRETLDRLAKDDDDNVSEAAVEGLRKVAGHDADPAYVLGLSRQGYQVVRASALAPRRYAAQDEALPALEAARQRLNRRRGATTRTTRVTRLQER